MIIKREIQGIFIPKEVWLDKALTIEAKFLYGHLTTINPGEHHDKEETKRLLGISKSKIEKALNILKERGHITVEEDVNG